MKPKSIIEIAGILCQNSDAIINNLDQESIDVYNFLMREFQQSDVSKNYVFQFTFRSYYRLDNAGLTPEFKTEYFRILEEERDNSNFDLEGALKRLYTITNRKGQNSLQFSFITKLFNTIDNGLPIYDSEVARIFGFKWPSQRSFDVKFKKLEDQLSSIKEVYKSIIDENLAKPVLDCFDQKFRNHNLSEMKRLDFIVWSAGKVISNKNSLATAKPNI